jgi:hypothetical protein
MEGRVTQEEMSNIDRTVPPPRILWRIFGYIDGQADTRYPTLSSWRVSQMYSFHVEAPERFGTFISQYHRKCTLNLPHWNFRAAVSRTP